MTSAAPVATAVAQIAESAARLMNEFATPCCALGRRGRHASGCSDTRSTERAFVASVADLVARASKRGWSPDLQHLTEDMVETVRLARLRDAREGLR